MVEVIGFFLGLLFGSFLNVCIARLPKHESIVSPRSHCPHCQTPIRWYDNIPLLSWLVLRGKCRDCKQPISFQYPLVELATGLWFATIGHRLLLLQIHTRLSEPTVAEYIAVLGLAVLG